MPCLHVRTEFLTLLVRVSAAMDDWLAGSLLGYGLCAFITPNIAVVVVTASHLTTTHRRRQPSSVMTRPFQAGRHDYGVLDAL